MRASRILFAIATLWSSMAFGQSGLPVQVQADMLKTRIVDAFGKGDTKAVLQGIADYRALSVPLPLPLIFQEARLAAVQGDHARTKAALDEYFKTAQSDDENYREALRLYSQIKPLIDGARRELADKRVPSLIQEIRSNMVSIPAGQFLMGNQAKTKNDAMGSQGEVEEPIHRVRVNAFFLSKYEVTLEQWDVFANATGKEPAQELSAGRGKEPAANLSWDDAQAFVIWLNQASGLKFRLPSEAEWEYAARAGTNSRFSWGRNFDPARANGAKHIGRITEVGRYPANNFGLYDMTGNVAEWTADCWNRSYAGAPTDGSAWNVGDCRRRMHRGGHWGTLPELLRVSFRLSAGTNSSAYFLGFRLAQDL